MKPLVLAALLAAAVAPASAFAQSTSPAPTTTTSSTTTTTTTAPAGQSPAMATMMTACAADFKAQCPDKTGPDMQSCVRENFDKMSDGCKGAIMTMMSQGGGGDR